MRVRGILLPMLTLGVTAVAGAERSQESPPVFGAGVELVRLDAIVLDRDGKPVTDLQAADFEVEEDGRKQEVTSFEPVVVSPRPTAPVVGPPRVAVARVRTPAEGRSVFVFFDDVHVQASNSERVRHALRQFLASEVREGDWITVMAPDQGIWWTARNGWEYRQIGRVIDRLNGQFVLNPVREKMSDFEAMCIVEGGQMCLLEKVAGLGGQQSSDFRPDGGVAGGSGGGGGASGGGGGTGGGGGGAGSGDALKGVGMSNPEFEAEVIYAAARHRIRLTLASLRQALESLVPLRGHKSLVLVSEGFLLISQMPGYPETIDVARRANVAIHFLDPRGLESGYSAEQVTAPGSGWATKRLLEAAGADDLAAATGGRTFANNDPLAGLRRVTAESEAYYLIGYQPAVTKVGERKVKVRVRREGLSVRARSRYYVPTEAELRAAAKESGNQAADFDPPAREAMRALDARTGAHAFKVACEAVRASDGSRIRDSFETKAERAPGLPVTLSRQWKLPAGVWQARLLVEDASTHRIGTAIHTFEVPEPKAFRISTPILAAALETGFPGSKEAAAEARPLVRARGSALLPVSRVRGRAGTGGPSAARGGRMGAAARRRRRARGDAERHSADCGRSPGAHPRRVARRPRPRGVCARAEDRGG